MCWLFFSFLSEIVQNRCKCTLDPAFLEILALTFCDIIGALHVVPPSQDNIHDIKFSGNSCLNCDKTPSKDPTSQS